MLWMTADLSLDNIYIMIGSLYVQVFTTPPWQLTSDWLIFLPLAICIVYQSVVYITNFSTFLENKLYLS